MNVCVCVADFLIVIKKWSANKQGIPLKVIKTKLLPFLRKFAISDFLLEEELCRLHFYDATIVPIKI